MLLSLFSKACAKLPPGSQIAYS